MEFTELALQAIGVCAIMLGVTVIAMSWFRGQKK